MYGMRKTMSGGVPNGAAARNFPGGEGHGGARRRPAPRDATECAQHCRNLSAAGWSAPSHAAADRISRLLSLYKERPCKRHGHRGGSAMTATAISRGCGAVSPREDADAAALSSG